MATYTFINRVEIEIKTVQERFFEIYYEQDAGIDNESRFHKACEQFVSEYKLKPPYANYNSFTTSMTNRRKGKQRK